MDGVREFLDSSTIHGLAHISSSKAVLVKGVWVVIVALGFFVSAMLIQQSFIEWNESPIGTSVETFPIKEVVFPKITVCPPKGSHTALNYFLAKSENLSLSLKQRKDLNESASKLVEERESWEIMVDSREFREKDKFRNWYEGISTVAFPFEMIRLPGSIIQTMEYHNGGENPKWEYSKNFKMETSAVSGSLETPWFGQSFDKELFITALDYRFGHS